MTTKASCLESPSASCALPSKMALHLAQSLMLVGCCALLSLGLVGCSSSSSEPQYMTAEEIIASHQESKMTLTPQNDEQMEENDSASDTSHKAEGFGLDNEETSWTGENTDLYLEALQNTDLIYDEATASFINVEGAPARTVVFGKLSQRFNADNTNVEYYAPDGQQSSAGGGDGTGEHERSGKGQEREEGPR